MPASRHTVTINRPPGEVFDFLADAENDIQWRPAVISMRHVSGSGVGSIFEQRVPGPGGRPVAADIEITGFERPSSLSFRTIAGPVRPVGSYHLVPQGSGTRLEFGLDAPVGGLKKLFSSMVQKTMDQEVAAIERLKEVLESG